MKKEADIRKALELVEVQSNIKSTMAILKEILGSKDYKPEYDNIVIKTLNWALIDEEKRVALTPYSLYKKTTEEEYSWYENPKTTKSKERGWFKKDYYGKLRHYKIPPWSRYDIYQTKLFLIRIGLREIDRPVNKYHVWGSIIKNPKRLSREEQLRPDRIIDNFNKYLPNLASAQKYFETKFKEYDKFASKQKADEYYNNKRNY